MADVLVFAGTPLGDYLLEAMGENAPVLAAVGDHRPEPVVELPPQVPTPRSVINEYFDRVSASGFDMESERVTNARAMKRRCRSLALLIAARDCAIVWSTADCHALVALFAAAVATSSPALSALLFCLLAAYFYARLRRLLVEALVDAAELHALQHGLDEHACSRALRLVSESELASHGFFVGASVASIARVDRRDRQRRLVVLREALRSSISALSDHVVTVASIVDASAGPFGGGSFYSLSRLFSILWGCGDSHAGMVDKLDGSDSSTNGINSNSGNDNTNNIFTYFTFFTTLFSFSISSSNTKIKVGLEHAIRSLSGDDPDASPDALSLLSLRSALLLATSQRATLAHALQSLPLPAGLSLFRLASLTLFMSDARAAASARRRRLDGCTRAAAAPAAPTAPSAPPAARRLAAQHRALNAALLSAAWRYQTFADETPAARPTALRDQASNVREAVADILRVCEQLELACAAAEEEEASGVGAAQRRREAANDARASLHVNEPRDTAPVLEDGDGAALLPEDQEEADPAGEEQVFEGAVEAEDWRRTRGPLLPREERIRLMKEKRQREAEEEEANDYATALMSELQSVLRVQNKWKEPPRAVPKKDEDE